MRLDALSNDRNVEIVNELKHSFIALGDANQMPSNAEFLGELAKNQNSGDDNVRLGFEINGYLSQAANSPGGGDVDTYSFRGTAGTPRLVRHRSHGQLARFGRGTCRCQRRGHRP